MKAGEVSFKHHWNKHEHCGEWCQTISWTAEEKEEKKGKFRDKEENPKEYVQQLKVKNKYLSATRMRRCFHAFCNNKTEQLHGFMVNVF
jgi:Fe-S-cluster containining protein